MLLFRFILTLNYETGCSMFFRNDLGSALQVEKESEKVVEKAVTIDAFQQDDFGKAAKVESYKGRRPEAGDSLTDHQREVATMFQAAAGVNNPAAGQSVVHHAAPSKSCFK